jgi:hypothetical protein
LSPSQTPFSPSWEDISTFSTEYTINTVKYGKNYAKNTQQKQIKNQREKKMGKGFVILILVGAAFAYMVFNFVSDIEQDDTRYPGMKKEDSSRYYKKDAAGDMVLDFTGASISKAKKIWSESPIKDDILDYFPNFEIMREMIGEELVDSNFRRYLLQKFDEVETDYLGGSIDSEKAREKLANP